MAWHKQESPCWWCERMLHGVSSTFHSSRSFRVVPMHSLFQVPIFMTSDYHWVLTFVLSPHDSGCEPMLPRTPGIEVNRANDYQFQFEPKSREALNPQSAVLMLTCLIIFLFDEKMCSLTLSTPRQSKDVDLCDIWLVRHPVRRLRQISSAAMIVIGDVHWTTQ